MFRTVRDTKNDWMVLGLAYTPISGGYSPTPNAALLLQDRFSSSLQFSMESAT